MVGVARSRELIEELLEKRCVGVLSLDPTPLVCSSDESLSNTSTLMQRRRAGGCGSRGGSGGSSGGGRQRWVGLGGSTSDEVEDLWKVGLRWGRVAELPGFNG